MLRQTGNAAWWYCIHLYSIGANAHNIHKNTFNQKPEINTISNFQNEIFRLILAETSFTVIKISTNLFTTHTTETWLTVDCS